MKRALCGIAVGIAVAGAAAAEQLRALPWDASEGAWHVRGVSAAGVEIDSGGGVWLVGWHRVRTLEGHATPETLAWLEGGRAAWRAVTRLERGDAFGAEPLFEAAMESLRGARGPSMAAIAEGLMRCRMRRGARAAALDAYFDLYETLLSAPSRDPRWGVGAESLDAKTLLVPALPPLWFDDEAARAFADRAAGPMPEGDESAVQAWALRVLYRAAAQHAVGDPIDADATARAAGIAARRAGAAFVADLVLAQAGGVEARTAARRALDAETVPGAEGWRSVWARVAIGRSLLREDGEPERRQGVLVLASVHALDAEVSPYLTGLALADAAVGCESLGDRSAARVFADELRKEYPGHPVLGWPAVGALWGPGPGRMGLP